MNIDELTAALANLSDKDVLELRDVLTEAAARGAKLPDEIAAAERERDERYPTCTCGRPATMAGYFRWNNIDIKPGIARWGFDDGRLHGGVIFVGEPNYRDDRAPAYVADVLKLLYVHCGNCSEPWKPVPNGIDLKVGEEW